MINRGAQGGRAILRPQGSLFVHSFTKASVSAIIWSELVA